MTPYRIDPLFGKMTLVDGQWTTTIRDARRNIPLTIPSNDIQWAAVHHLWHVLQPKLEEIRRDVAECCHYDYSIEWGNAFPLTEEQTLSFIQLEAIHFSQYGCQLRYRSDFATEKWATTPKMSEPTILVVEINWDGEIEHLDYD